MDKKFKALSDLVNVVCSLANTLVAAPKPLTLSSLSALWPLLPQVESLSGEISQVIPEVKAMQVADYEALLAQIVADIAITDPKEKAIIAASLKVVLDAFDLVKVIQG